MSSSFRCPLSTLSSPRSHQSTALLEPQRAKSTRLSPTMSSVCKKHRDPFPLLQLRLAFGIAIETLTSLAASLASLTKAYRCSHCPTTSSSMSEAVDIAARLKIKYGSNSEWIQLPFRYDPYSPLYISYGSSRTYPTH